MSDYIVPVVKIVSASVLGYLLYYNIKTQTSTNQLKKNLKDLQNHIRQVTNRLLNVKNDTKDSKEVTNEVDMQSVE